MKRWLLLAVMLLATACGGSRYEEPLVIPSTPWFSPTPAVAALPPTATVSPLALPPTPTPRPPSPTATPAPSATVTPSPTVAPSETVPPPSATMLPPTASATPAPPTVTVAPAGIACARPPEAYRRVQVRGHTLSERTLAMLDNAQALYGGRGSMRLIIQGSYDVDTSASFGTHDAGGAVDIWAVEPADTSRLLEDIPAMVRALRQAGFAAWYRPADMLYPGMYPHIHAIAVGDAELSQSAMAQLTGEQGYFRGRNGLPQPEFQGEDPFGGPILCPWMETLGYTVVATTTAPAATAPATTTPTATACAEPAADYQRITVDGHLLNRRTYGMLLAAQALYGGAGNLLWITQGSYSEATEASFGTHAGGGAVDISIRHPQSYEFLYSDTERMVQALRQAGFAAWYRSPDDGFVPHIHAIAIGDGELSEEAQAQLTGVEGYFRGRNALPDERAAPDPHGGPILCPWMEALGYRDQR